MDLKSFTQAIQQIADEKGISKEKIIETIELALAAAYKRDYGKKGQIVRAKLNPETGRADLKQYKIAVDESMIKSEEEIEAEEKEKAEEEAKRQEALARGERLPQKREEEEEMQDGEKKVRFNPEKHLMMEEAQKIKPDVKPGDELEFPLEYHEEYGRIAAQTAKQVIIQRIREAERDAVYEEYKNREGELVSGIVQRIEGRNVYLDIGRTVGVIPAEEQIPYERYRAGERLKALITLVEKNPKGPGVFLSRSHPAILKKLFEMEVPEIASGAVEIKAIAREPGSRAKVAVISHETGVDPVGSLVGQKGIRVSTVINELGGEKIDIIEWSENPADFIAHSLSPAKVLDVEINEDYREARVLVNEDQLSLAIGRGGQNVRLAAKLTGWKIDVRPSRSGKAVEVGEEEKSESEEAEPQAPGEKAENGAAEENESAAKKETKKEEKPKKKKASKK